MWARVAARVRPVVVCGWAEARVVVVASGRAVGPGSSVARWSRGLAAPATPPPWRQRSGVPKMNPRKGDPMLKEVLRQFLKRVHPDVFGQFPELRAKNEASMQKLMEVLAAAKSGEHDDQVPAMKYDMEFFVRTDKPNAFKRVPLSIRTTANDCKHVVGHSLSQLFGHCGLPTTFHWGDEYWDRKIVGRKPTPEEEEAER